jgi:hypothetical protein
LLFLNNKGAKASRKGEQDHGLQKACTCANIETASAQHRLNSSENTQ